MLPPYNGTTDPVVHLSNFSIAMKVAQTDADEVKCQAFPVILSGRASRWFHELIPLSVDSFRVLGDAHHCKSIAWSRKPLLHQKEWEQPIPQ